MKRLAMTLMLALALTACRDDDRTLDTVSGAPVEATAQLSPEELGTLGAAIQKEPARADQLLAEKNLNAEAFEAQIRKTTEDPNASKQYAAAFKRAQTQ